MEKSVSRWRVPGRMLQEGGILKAATTKTPRHPAAGNRGRVAAAGQKVFLFFLCVLPAKDYAKGRHLDVKARRIRNHGAPIPEDDGERPVAELPGFGRISGSHEPWAGSRRQMRAFPNIQSRDERINGRLGGPRAWNRSGCGFPATTARPAGDERSGNCRLACDSLVRGFCGPQKLFGDDLRQSECR